MKKIISLLLSAAMLLFLLTGCSSGAADTYKITVEGSIFGGASDDKIETSVKFDLGWITKKDNTKFNPDLAQFAAILSDDIYFRPKDLDKGTQNRVLSENADVENYDRTSFLQELGFTETSFIETFRSGEFTVDTNDSATMVLAHLCDGKYDVYVVVMRGCFSAQEWVSTFDPGFMGASYTDLTGEHSEWTNANNMKGLDVSFNRSMRFIDEFMQANNDPDAKDCVLVTGHSRGGALADMIGAEMEKRDDVKSYTYTFNTPNLTLDEDAADYKTIFNVFDTNDFYTDPLPFGEEKFRRYGKDMTMAIADSDEVKAAIAELKGRDDYACMSAEAKAEYAKLFGERFPDRASLYEMQTVTQIFDTQEEALARAEAIYSLISAETGLGLEGLCSLEGLEEAALAEGEEIDISAAVFATDDGKFEVKMTYCSAAILVSYAMTLAYGAAAYEGTVQLFEEDSQACEILNLLMANAAGLTGGHQLANGFVLSQFVK